MRRRHVIRIARFADAEQADRVVVGVAGRVAFEQPRTPPPRRSRCRRVHIERPARPRREQFERVEAVERRETERIDAADHGRIDQTGFEHAPRRAEHLRARRTRRRHRHRRSAQPEVRAHEAGERIGIVRGRVVEVGGQRAGLRIAPLVGELGFENARRARAHEHADALRAVTRRSLRARARRSRPASARVARGGCCGSRIRRDRRVPARPRCRRRGP